MPQYPNQDLIPLIFLDLYALIYNPVYCVKSYSLSLSRTVWFFPKNCGFVGFGFVLFQKIMVILIKTREF